MMRNRAERPLIKSNDMKKILAIGIVAASLAACGQKRAAELDAREAQVEQQEKTQDSLRIVEDTRDQMAADQAATQAQKAVVHSAHSGSAHTATSSSATSSTTTASSTPAATTEAEKKKGLSNKAKGAIIGAGVGAVTGAVIDKNHRGIGALIGAGVGAGAGLGAGAIIDNKKKQSGGN